MRMVKYLLPLLFILAMACNKQVINPNPTDFGYTYYPLTYDKYVIYEVDSIIYNDFALRNDTVHLQIKDVIGDSFIDNQGKLSFIVNRYKRYEPNGIWIGSKTYYVMQDEDVLEWQEDDLRFKKMVYPVKLNTKWKGNIYISGIINPELQWYNGWDYKYTSLATSFNTGYKNYNDVHQILQRDSISGLEGNPNDFNSYSALTYSKEVYARNTGLVFKELTHWEYQPTVVKWRKGFTVIMRAKSNN